MTLGAVVADAARRFADRAAVVAPRSSDGTGGWALTYAQLDRLSDEVAAGLQHRGVRHGDVVALVLPSSPEYLIAYVAAAKLGAITAGLNPRLAARQRDELVAAARPRLLVATPELAGDTELAKAVQPVDLADSAEQCLATLRRSPTTPSRQPQPHDPLAIVFTSGTAGPPKGAVFTHAHLASIASLDAGDRRDGGGPMLVSTELVHVGVMTKLGWYLRTGATLHLLRRWRARDALTVIAEQRITSVGAIAPQIALLLREPDFDRFDVSAVTTIVAGGAPSPPALVTEARDRFGAQYSIRYSSTESGGVGTATAFDAADEEALYTVGRPRPGVALQLRAPDTGSVITQADQPGIVWLRSAAVMAGYWRDPDATGRTLQDGWLCTGDLGLLDAAGCLRLLGRNDDRYIRGGYNVHPQAVEAVLADHPQVREVAVVPRGDPVLGHIGVAVVVPADPHRPPTLDELRGHARERLAHHELPEALAICTQLPRNATDKIDRRALRDDLTQRQHAS